MKETKRRGRPCKEVCKDEQIHLRMTQGEVVHINDLTNRSGKSRSELIRDALELYEHAMNLNDKKGDK